MVWMPFAYRAAYGDEGIKPATGFPPAVAVHPFLVHSVGWKRDVRTPSLSDVGGACLHDVEEESRYNPTPMKGKMEEERKMGASQLWKCR